MPTAPRPRPQGPPDAAPRSSPPGGPRARPIWPAALGGFVLGAGTVLLVVWVYGRHGGFGPGLPAPGVPAGSPGLPAAAPPTPGRPGTAPPGGLPSAAPAPWNPPGPAATPGAGRSAPGGAPAPAASPATAATAADVELLRGRRLLVPVQGVRPEDVRDSFSDPRGGGGRVHDAMDVMAPRNTPVLAVDDGQVAKLFQSRQGGITIYQFDPTGTYCFYYAHLDRYANDLREGAPVRRGQLLGFVGSTGNADVAAPHLHFAVFRLPPDKHWWQGTPLNPYLLFHPR